MKFMKTICIQKMLKNMIKNNLRQIIYKKYHKMC